MGYRKLAVAAAAASSFSILVMDYLCLGVAIANVFNVASFDKNWSAHLFVYLYF